MKNEYTCKICGYTDKEAFWVGPYASYDNCPCCNAEAGFDDLSFEQIKD
jgi:lipopolysaccharide biosynthesis regulator YciM